MAADAIASSLAEETRESSTVGADRACSNGESRENKYGNGISESASSVCTLKSICHGYK